MSRIIPTLSKIWLKVVNLENSLFPKLQESLRIEEFSSKESKLIRVLDFAEIEKFVTITSPTNTPKYREQIARAFIAKSVYNLQTTRDLIDRLQNDRTLRILCGWRYKNEIPSEATFSRAFDEISELIIAQKAHEKFVQKYLGKKIFFYDATDATKISLREKPVKKDKEETRVKYKAGRPKKGEAREPIKPKILEQQKELQTVKEKLSLISTDCGVGVKQNSKVLKAKIELQKHERETFTYLNQHLNCDKEHYNQRSMVERVNKLLKDDFGCNTIYYQGAVKVASVLAFGTYLFA